MRTLTRYLMLQNAFYMGVCLAAGVTVYTLADLFDRLDDFLEAGLGLGTILTYFVVKIPLMISQLLPAVFLVSCLIQLSVMAKNREITALESGGVSLAAFVRFFLIYGMAWFLMQLVFSQVVGVRGEQAANRIWKEDVRSQKVEGRAVKDIWFKDGRRIVAVKEAWPAKNMGKDVTIYFLGKQPATLQGITRADSFTVADNGAWELRGVESYDPATFSSTTVRTRSVKINQDLSVYAAVDPKADPATLPLWRLSAIIDQLEASGSNVEGLRTVWHMKWAYAFTLVVMGFVALAVITWRRNIYFNVTVGLLVTFAFYGVFMVGVTAGQRGMAPPLLAAWTGNILFMTLAAARLAWFVRPRWK